MVRVLRALANPNRFRMVQEVAAAALSCTQLGAKFDLSQPTVSHRLKILVEAGVCWRGIEAQLHFISLNRKVVDRVASLLPARLGPRRPSAKPRARPAAIRHR